MTQQSKSGMEQVRDSLLKTLKDIQDGTITPEKAKAVTLVSQTCINAAKVEIEYLNINKNASSAFFERTSTTSLDGIGATPSFRPAPITYDKPNLSILSDKNRTITQEGNVTTVKVR